MIDAKITIDIHHLVSGMSIKTKKGAVRLSQKQKNKIANLLMGTSKNNGSTDQQSILEIKK